MWFGDLVTMRWWDDLWLNESFAEYMAHRCCTEATDYPLWTEFGIVRKAWGYAVDQSDATHPIAGNGAADAATALANFDGISYAKGAAVLRQLASYLGDDVYLAGLRRYFDDHRFGNAEFAELVACWTAAGGVDLEHWTKQWLLTSGVDTLAVRGPAGDQQIVRTAPAHQPADRSHAIRVASLGEDGRALATASTVVGDPGVGVDRPDGTVAVVPDAGDETWAKIRFADTDWQWIARNAGRIASSDTRTVIWNSLRDQVRDAELDPRDALETLIGQLPAETDDVAVGHLLQFGQRALAGAYAPIADRADRLARVHELARTMLEASDPGADRRLVAFRTVITSCADADLLDDWRNRRRLPAGIDLDPELTWAIVTRICQLVDRPDVIEETLAADRSAAAQVHAARARAALPTADAKAAAYRLLVEPSDLSNYEVYATAEAMFGWSATQVDLTRPYALRFFDDIPQTTRFRSGWVLGRVPALAFPLAVTEPEVLARAEALHGSEDTPPVIRRVLAEEIDPLRRAVTAVQRFAG
jgi:aminopeptidase N